MTTSPKSPEKPAIPEPELNLKALPPIEETAFRDLLAKSWIAQELFLPLGRAAWDGERYSFGRGEQQAPTVSGVRFQEPDPNRVDRHRERGCQVDTVALVRSVAEMRKLPQLGNVVLGLEKDVAVGTQAGNADCKRGLFGLACPADARFKSDNDAAAHCHQEIIRAGKKAGFKLREEVPDYDAKTGFKGLLEWADRVKWKKIRRPPWKLLFLLPLLFLPIWCFQTEKMLTFFDTEIDTDSVLILMDISGSVDKEKELEKLRDEAGRFLASFRRKYKNPYANIIFYDKEPDSVLRGLRALDDETVARLKDSLRNVKVKCEEKGCTKLENAMPTATDEVVRHFKKTGKPTTILILTDGFDLTLKPMTNEIAKEKQKAKRIAAFEGSEPVLKWITPRFMGNGKPPPPTDEGIPAERGLDAFTDAVNSNVAPGRPLPRSRANPASGGSGGGAGPGGGGSGPRGGSGPGGGGGGGGGADKPKEPDETSVK